MAKGYSIHIGVNKADPAHYHDLPELACCINDANQLSNIARSISFSKVELLLNETATAENFTNLIDKWKGELTKGDTLWITYSGHGGQKPDLNGDDEDKWDETWCLYNREFLDDEQFEAYSKLAEGVKVIIFSDSCHSGTVARAINGNNIGVSVTISTQPDWETFKRQKNAKSRQAPPIGCIKRFVEFKDLYEPIAKRAAVDRKKMNPYVVLFAACQDNQECIEYGTNGYFTSVMLSTLQDIKNYPTYNDLYKKIQAFDIGVNQNANLDQYGNEQYKFDTTFPLSIDGNPFGIKNRSGDGTETTTNSTDEIIVHKQGEARARSTDDKNEKIDLRIVETAQVGKTPWDKAYLAYYKKQAAGKPVFIEPNVKSNYAEKKVSRGTSSNTYLSNWPQPTNDPTEFIWHLDDDHSELRKAADEVIKKYGTTTPKIRIAHIDTGYTKHISQPKNLLIDLGKNFINGQDTNNAEDKFETGFPAEQDGHGCATLAILAGNEIKNGQGYVAYQGSVGAIPFAEVIPIRICETVYNLFNANDVARAIDYAVDNDCEVITMSMAGYPTKTVASAVNRAYEKGVVIVTAAGNNWFEGIQKAAPKSVLYPARFERVIAATGACFDGFPYDSDAPRTNNIRSRTAGGEVMQGNWGPESVMDHALAAYTPNLFWANNSDDILFLRNGGGTSSATPQVAAAAALWIAFNRDNLSKLDPNKPWQKVEAARKALFETASKAYPLYKKYYGNGILRAHKALTHFSFTQKDIDQLKPSDKAKVSFLGIIPFIKQWFRSKAAADTTETKPDEVLAEMFSTEILQLIHMDPNLVQYAEQMNFDKEEDYVFFNEPEGRKEFLTRLAGSKYISEELKKQVTQILQTT